MKLNSKIKGLVSVAVAATMLLSTGISALADDSPYAASESVRVYRSDFGFDVRGFDGNAEIQTTFRSYYRSTLKVGDTSLVMGLNDRHEGEAFDFGKEYAIGDISASIDASVVGNAAYITYSVKNNGSADQTVSIGSCTDTQLDGNDNVPVRLTSNGIVMEDTSKNLKFVVIPGGGNFTTRFVGNYGDAWDSTFVNSDNDSYDEDSGIAYSWTLDVPAGQTVTRTSLVAAGDISLVNIAFDANGGEGTMTDMSVIGNIPVALTPNEFTRDGYTFEGWATSADATSAEYADGASVTLTSDTTLYAVWTEDEPVTPTPDPDPVTPTPDPDPVTPTPDPDPVTPTPDPDPVTPTPDPDPVTPTPEPDPVATVSMYRLYNPNSGEHFYTASAGERNHLIGLGWNDEGIGWTAPARSNTPVYRLYNQNGGEHHFTTSVAERNNLIGLGWNDEGIGWYSDDARAVPVYRQYNPNAFANNHNFTTSSAENDHLVSLGWRAEGIGWYGV